MALTALCFLALVLVVSSQNPFANQRFYINPSYERELDTSIATATGQVKINLQTMRNISSAYWIDVMRKISGTSTDTVEGILMDAAIQTPIPLVVFIIYDLPNRDCHARASNGEICCYPNPDGTCNYNTQGDCAEGLYTYKTKYIDPMVEVSPNNLFCHF